VFSTNRTEQLPATFIGVPLDPAREYTLKVWNEHTCKGNGVVLNRTMVIPYNDEWVAAPPR
jgi:hypothetical protein